MREREREGIFFGIETPYTFYAAWTREFTLKSFGSFDL